MKKKIVNIIRNPLYMCAWLCNAIHIYLPDKLYLKILYKYRLNKKLNLEHPVTFNEKLQWLKLNDRKEIYTTMVDKYYAKEYVASIIGEEYIIPTLGLYEKIEDIDFSTLPNQFVIKCTHDSHGLVIVTDKEKINLNAVKKKIKASLNKNYFYSGREWPYKNVKPQIIIEKYMEDDLTEELRDYKFFCFNEKVKCFKIDFNRSTNHQANYYDKNGNLLRFGEIVCPPDFDKPLAMPTNLKKMIINAEKLSKNTKFLRVDFYEVNGKMFFGELTFYPASGLGKFTADEWDKKMGDMLVLTRTDIDNHNEK